MSITCKICNTEFPRIIPWQHLKIHGISSAQYKLEHGSLYSEETLKKHQERVPHNKGQKLTDQTKLENLRNGILTREQRYASGEFTRPTGRTLSEDQKQALSDKQKLYAANNPEIMKDRAKRAIMTKIQNGYDFGSPMRGKSQTEISRSKSRENMIEVNHRRIIASNEQIEGKLQDLNLTLLNDMSSKIFQLKCNNCSEQFSFTKQYFQPSKFKVTICPTCFPRTKTTSNAEDDIYAFILSLCPDAVQSYRPYYHCMELDVFVPSLSIGIEFNGLYWHSEPVLLSNNKPKNTDFLKKKEFDGQGVRLIQIFEDEWKDHQEIVKSRLSNILGKTQNKIYARKCDVRQITGSAAAKFCELYHIMGKGRSNLCFGLYYQNELISVMTFTKSNLSRKGTSWELNRFCSILNYSIVGGASRLFKAFIEYENPDSVVSYADNRWSNGDLYKSLGFERESAGTPNYWYIPRGTCQRVHRFNLRKSITDNQDLTEAELRESEGYSRIWDCGSSKWKWVQPS
jgi:hypothetical protein